MLGSLRKFSGSIYAKILLGIIVIPFVFWGMGSSFVGGSKNIVVIIDNEKYPAQEFVNFIQKFADPNEKISSNQVEEFLSAFIGEKLVEHEVKHFKIKLSDDSLGKLVKHQADFKKKNKFSRIEYEKFLIKNNITAATFETSLSNLEKKEQLLDFIGGGIFPSQFLVNNTYNKINQKRNIQLINLDDLLKKEFNFSEEQIKSHYENNKNDYKEIYKSVKIFELTPKKLIGDNEFNDVFFKNIDEIDDIIIQGENLDYIVQKFNLEKPNIFTLNELGQDMNSKIIEDIPNSLGKKIFSLDDSEPTALIEVLDKYFIVEVIKTENIIKNLENETLKKTILINLKKKAKRKFIAEIASKINQNNFIKSDFDKLSKEKNIAIEKISLLSQNDNKILKNEIDNIKEEMVRELTIGIADTGIRAGIIGEIGTGQPLYSPTDKWDSTDDPDMGPTEEKVLRAAGRAQVDTGAPVSVHTYNYRPNRLGHHVLDVLEEEGADLEKIVICHLDTRPDVDYVKSIADRGAFVEFDTFGMEIDTEFGVSTRDLNRIALVEETIRQGYLENILISQDVCRKNMLMCYGGLGYAHISRDIEPRMRHVGISDENIKTMRVENPARWLSY